MNWFQKLVNRITAYIPSPLPLGVTEFNAWAGSVLALTPLPDNESTRFALASTLPHQPFNKFLIRRIFFARLLMKSAANQVAFGIMEELKAKQAARQAAQEQAEATAHDGSNVPLQIESV